MPEPAGIPEAWRERDHRGHGIVAFPGLTPRKTAEAMVSFL
jgi:hypothetical protein